MSKELLKKCKDTLDLLVALDEEPCQDLARLSAEIEEELEKPELAPAAWMYDSVHGGKIYATRKPNERAPNLKPLYTHPQ